MKSLLLKKAKIQDPSSPFHLQTQDILIENGKISRIQSEISKPEHCEILELDNLHVSQGWFDASVSFGEPGLEERETLIHGCDVASKSGFTDIALNLDTNPCGDQQSTLSFVQNITLSSSCKVWPIANLTTKGEGLHLAELFDLKNAGAIAFGDYNHAISDDLLMKISLQYAQNFDGLIMSFPENKRIAGTGLVNESPQSMQLGLKSNPILAETLQISRDLFLLEYTGGKLHIPCISSAKSLKLISQAKANGLDVSCSVSVHHLVLNDHELFDFDSNTKVKPPLRTEEDRLALIQGLKDGLIDFIVSDHRPIDIEEKKVAYNQAEYGTIGLESAFSALQNVLDLDLILEKLTVAPRNRFKLESYKIDLDQPAKLSLFDPNPSFIFENKDILSTSKNSIFKGKQLKGKVYGSINQGKIVLK